MFGCSGLVTNHDALLLMMVMLRMMMVMMMSVVHDRKPSLRIVYVSHGRCMLSTSGKWNKSCPTSLALTTSLCGLQLSMVLVTEPASVSAVSTDIYVHLVPSLFAYICLYAPRTWNRLPASIRAATSLSTFRQELKTFLFRSSYQGHHH